MANSGEIDSVRTAVEFGSEVLIPGGSNLVKGDLKVGGLYALAGLAARYAFGPAGLLLVSASSFTKALTGRHLFEHIGLEWKHKESGDHGQTN